MLTIPFMHIPPQAAPRQRRCHATVSDTGKGGSELSCGVRMYAAGEGEGYERPGRGSMVEEVGKLRQCVGGLINETTEIAMRVAEVPVQQLRSFRTQFYLIYNCVRQLTGMSNQSVILSSSSVCEWDPECSDEYMERRE